MADVKITVKDLKTWMSVDTYAMCKEIGVTIGTQSSYVQGSKHINPTVYYAAARLQELDKMLATSTALNVEFARRLEKFGNRFNQIDAGLQWHLMDREAVMLKLSEILNICQELVK